MKFILPTLTALLGAQAMELTEQVPVEQAHEYCSQFGSGLQYQYADCMETVWQSAALGVPGERALLKSNMGLINEYGCWCFFEDEFVGGQGATQDPLDEICRTLSHGYDCILMDFDTGNNGTCTPYEVVYNSAFGSGLAPFGLTMANLVDECDAQNVAGSCEAAVCKVEGWFLLSYFTWTVFGGQMDSSKMASNGFDHDDTCKGIKALAAGGLTPAANNPFPTGNNNGNSAGSTPVNDIPTEKKCCGDHPLRFPYNHSDALKMCCNGVTYNPNLLECCPNNSVQTLGSC